MPEAVAVIDSGGYWGWRDEVLRHPDGRAVGGEPCVLCGEPVPPNAAWIHRDRHVCSARCNRRLCRAFTRQREQGQLNVPTPYPDLIEDPRQDLSPRFFAPGEVYGLGPVHGDVVERYGIRTGYRWVKPGGGQANPDAPEGYLVSIHESGHSSAVVARRDGRSTRMLWGDFDPAGERTNRELFTFDGVVLIWTFEMVRQITESEEEYTWRARVCVPVEHRTRGAVWSTEYAARSEQRRRISASTARHARRLRVEAATVERFDPVEVFERDGWICGLCGEPIERSLAWPDPASVSLDHVLPLAAGGDHSRANTQPAHWICNVRKGARTG